MQPKTGASFMQIDKGMTKSIICRYADRFRMRHIIYLSMK